MHKTFKFVLKLGLIGLVVFLVYITIPKINVSESDVQIELERYEHYVPSEILETFLTQDSELYIQNNFGFKKVDIDEPFALENDTVLRVVQKKTFYQGESITFEISAIDTIAPIIEVQDEITLGGGETLVNALDIQIYDYRYGAYDYELKAPSLDFVSIIPGTYDYEIVAQDLSGNQSSATLKIKVQPVEIAQQELNSLEIWVNPGRYLPMDYQPELTEIISSEKDPIHLQTQAAVAFEKMVNALDEAHSVSLKVNHGYLSYEALDTLYQSNPDMYQKPGFSEYQTGLAIDLDLDQQSEALQWLKENAHRFGFIFRYPEDTENSTGVTHRPYHLRFVDETLASYLNKTNITLDQYKIENLK